MENYILILWEKEITEKAMLKLLTRTEQKSHFTHSEAWCVSSAASFFYTATRATNSWILLPQKYFENTAAFVQKLFTLNMPLKVASENIRLSTFVYVLEIKSLLKNNKIWVHVAF